MQQPAYLLHIKTRDPALRSQSQLAILNKGFATTTRVRYIAFSGEIDATYKLYEMEAVGEDRVGGIIPVIVAVASRKCRHAEVCSPATLQEYKSHASQPCHIVLKSLQSIEGKKDAAWPPPLLHPSINHAIRVKSSRRPAASDWKSRRLSLSVSILLWT